MARIVINVDANIAKAKQLVNALSHDLDALKRQGAVIAQVERGIANRAAGQTLLPMNSDPGRAYVTKMQTELQQFGNTVKQTTRWARDLDGVLLTGSAVTYAGNVDKITHALDKYNTAAEQAAAIERRRVGTVKSLTQSFQPLIEKQQAAIISGEAARLTAQARIARAQGNIADAVGIPAQAQRELDAVRRRVGNQQARVGVARASFAAGDIDDIELARVTARLQRLEAQIGPAQAKLTAALTDQARVISTNTRELDQATQAEVNASRRVVAAKTHEATLTNARGIEQSKAFKIARDATAPLGLAGLAANYQAARTAPPPLPTNIGQIAVQSPDLLRRLTKAGIAGPTGDVAGLYSTGAAQSFKVQEDLARRVTRVTGSFTDQFGALKSINAEYNRAGQVVTRLGGRLGGLSSAVTQVGRDFQKVAEFALATTVIYGAVRKLSETVGTINELDKQIRQLGITSGLTAQDTTELFSSLADVGIATATPLQEIIGAADNIALAVRSSGDTVDQYKAKIISLSESVGVLTNITGIDTVKATDLLTSAYKQLGLTVGEIPGLLSKISAVSGGQSEAMSDVTEAIAQVGEAAKVGGLDVNALIGTVQVLSQVTAKSPKEIATSIKNLIGSLASPGSIKLLKTYGIALKDENDNVKSILDVYGEINAKIASGQIKSGDVQAVVRAISGGPRRAPDAAALLGAYDQIGTAVQKAMNSSNEALLANQKILGGTEAKMVALQATFDKFAVEKFRTIVADVAGNLADVLITILKILEGMDTGIFHLIGTFGLLFVGGKALTSVVGTLFGAGVRAAEGMGLMNRGAIATANSFRVMAIEAQKASIAASGLVGGGALAGPLMGPAGPVGRGRYGASAITGLAGNVGRIGVTRVAAPLIAGSLAGVALGAATGGDGKEMLQNALFGVGFAALAIPEPVISKIVASVGIIGGTLLSLIPAEEKVEEAAGATTDELLSSITTYRQAAEVVAGLTISNDKLAVAIKTIQDIAKPTSEDILALAANQRIYADNTLAAINANITLEESFGELLKSVDKIPGISEQTKLKIKLARNGNLDDDTVKNLTTEITRAFLQAADPEKYGNIADFKYQIPLSLDIERSTAIKNLSDFFTFVDTEIKERAKSTADPNLGMAAQIADFWSKPSVAGGGGSLMPAGVFDGPQGAKGIPFFGLAIDALAKDMQAALDPATKYDDILKQLSINSQALEFEAAFGIISTDELVRGQQLNELLARAVILRRRLTFAPVTEGISSRPGTSARPGYTQEQADADLQIVTANTAAKNKANEAGESFKLTEAQAIKVGEATLRLSGRFDDLNAKGATLEAIKKMFSDIGYEVEWATSKIDDQIAAMDKLREKNKAAINAGYNAELPGLIDKRSSIEAKIRGEQLTPSTVYEGDPERTKEDADARARRIAGYQEELDQVNALIRGNAALRAGLHELNEVDPEGLEKFEQSLKSIHGLEAIALGSTEDLAGALIDIAEQFGLTGAQADEFFKKLVQLAAAIAILDGMKAQITIEIERVDKWAKMGEDAYVPGLVGPPTPGLAGSTLDNEIKAREARNKKTLEDLEKILKGGKGDSLGNIPDPDAGRDTTKEKEAKKPDVSTLDVTDEIYKSTNREALLNEAERRARAVQALVPGETEEAKDDIVALLHGTEHLENIRGVKAEYLRKAIEELTEIEKKRLEFDTKADTIRRIRVGTGDFAALANVPLNSRNNISVGSPQGPIQINLNISGRVLTPAQISQISNDTASGIASKLAGSGK